MVQQAQSDSITTLCKPQNNELPIMKKLKVSTEIPESGEILDRE